MSEDQRNRPSAGEVYDRVVEHARDEITRPGLSLAISALFAGFTMGASALGVAAMHAAGVKGPAALLLYPLGFIAVIIGRAQLFTENTLYPVVLALHERGHVGATARLWAIVFAANMLGAVLFALLVVESPGIDPAIADEVARLGAEALDATWFTTFWSGVLAGWLIALVAWLVEAGDMVIGQVAVIFALTFLVAVAQLDHVIASAIEVIAGIIEGRVHTGQALGWLSAVTAGNIVGGVFIVSLLNFGQVKADEEG